MTNGADEPDETNGEPETDGGTDEPVGDTRWVIPGGHVPVDSTGPEPEMVSHDRLCLLNAGDDLASLEITLLYADGREAGPYPLTVAAKRVRHVRINDLIDPYAPPLGKDYAVIVDSSAPIVVQFGRTDSRQAENATFSTIAYGED